MKSVGNRAKKSLFFILFLFLSALAAQGATFTVTKTADTNDGSCNADCSFREAVAQVNANQAGGVTHRIEFSALFDTPQTIALLSRLEITYNSNVEIIGRGTRSLTLTTAAGNTNSILEINSDYARVFNIRFANADTSGGQGGGAIVGNDGGDLLIERCLFENNRADEGGAVNIQANFSVTIKDSTFRGNQATTGRGGAVFLQNYDDQIISGSVFSGNQAANGSAVFLDAYLGLFTNNNVTNSTFSGNTSSGGATIYNSNGSLDLVNITAANNSGTTEAVDSSGSFNALANITNSIVSLNTGGNLGSNVIQNAPNLIGGDPLIGALAFNGGDTETLALLAGSPAIDAGTSVAGVPTDQRGVPRPQGAGVDLGAFEKDTLPAPPVFAVTKTSDTSDGVCNADCSLREAVEAATNSPQASPVIEFSALFDLPQTIVLSSQLRIAKNIEIRGKGRDKLAISGGRNSSLFYINPPSGSPVPTVLFRDLQLTEAPTAIYNNSGNLTIENCLFSNNVLSLTKYGGAALHHHSGTLAINNSVFRNNRITGSDSGGAISLYTGTATITNSTFTGNSAVSGSVFHSEFGTTNFINSTISGNTARADSFSQSSVVDTALGTITMINVTVTGNSIHGNGTTVGHEGLEVNRIRIKNTIIAGNVSLPLWSAAAEEIILGISSSNVIGVTSSGNNIVGFAFPNDGFPVGMPNANGDYVGTSNAPLDPLLDQLHDNGGATETHALLKGSLAIDHGTSAGAPTTDQRGVSRPQGAGFDIGSFEKDTLSPTPTPTPTATPTPTPTPTPQQPQFVTDGNLPAARENVAYSQQITVTGGVAPYNFSLVSGALPNGITLSSDGFLGGAPTATGGFSFVIKVVGADGGENQKQFNLNVREALQFVTGTNLPDGTINQSYSQQITAAGGATPYSFSLIGGVYPNSMNLSADGLLSGTPGVGGSFTLIVLVTDAEGFSAQQTFNWTVLDPLRFDTGSDLPHGVETQFYAQRIFVAGGTPPYSISLLNGALPPGLTLETNGFIDGFPSQTGTFSFTLGATDAAAASIQKTFNLRVIGAPPQIIRQFDLPRGYTNRVYSEQIIFSGGTAPVVFSLIDGSLPAGVTLSPDGLISGTPTQSGFFWIRVRATDGEGLFDETEFRLFINSLPQFVTGEDLPTAFINQHYSQRILVTGGSQPLTFSLISGGGAGFGLTTDGYIYGTPTQSISRTFVVRVQDGWGDTVDKTFNLFISRVFTVTKTADSNDGACDADCSLREAVNAAQAAGGVVEFSSLFDTPQTIALGSSIFISGNQPLEIRGKGADKLTIDAFGGINPFNIFSFSRIVIRNLRIVNSTIAIRSSSINGALRLTIENCVFENNFSSLYGGALLHNSGTLVVRNSVFRNNMADQRGGAVSVGGNNTFNPISALIENSTFTGNSSVIGSAIHVDGSTGNTRLRITNSTFSGNISSASGCTTCNSTIISEGANGIAFLFSSTVAGNDVFDASGAALRARLGGAIQVKNSIVANNFGRAMPSPTSPNIGAGVVSAGNNLIGFATGFAPGTPNANGDYVGSAATPLDPQLAPLGNNGGETQTYGLLVGSPAIDHGNSVGDFPATDQRGAIRPQGAGIDIGAFESAVPVTSGNTPAGSNVTTTLGTVAVTFADVAQAGTSTQIPIDPTIAGTLPGGFSFGAGLPAFQITSDANFTAPVTVCIEVPGVTTQAQLNMLYLFHYENGILVDRTSSRTLLPSPTVCAQTTSLSPFAVGQGLAPTAASVSISGRILSEKGGIARARVLLTDASGNVRTTVSNSFGYYRFDDIEAGQIVILEVRSKLYQFEPRVVAVSDNLSNVDFTALETKSFGKLPDD